MHVRCSAKSIWVICLMFWASITMVGWLSTALASMPPEEIERKKRAAVLQVVGQVTEDNLLEETTDKAGYPMQIRKMSLLVQEINKAPLGTDVGPGKEITVYYHYVPVWAMANTSCVTYLDVRKGDRLEMWLRPDKEGWSSVVPGYERFLLKIKDRPEHIPEPFSRVFWRVIEENVISFLFVLAVLGYLFFVIRKWRQSF